MLKKKKNIFIINSLNYIINYNINIIYILRSK